MSAHEWSKDAAKADSDELIVKDANGDVLKESDMLTVIKDLKVKGSSSTIKIGKKSK
jgi:protein PhnA